MTLIPYSEMSSDLRNIYLEDSYVDSIVLLPRVLQFHGDYVLRESHPDFHHPLENENYCYSKGVLIFKNIEEIEFRNSSIRMFPKTEDFGNIDRLDFCDIKSIYIVEGDWGEIVLRSSNVPSFELVKKRY